MHRDRGQTTCKEACGWSTLIQPSAPSPKDLRHNGEQGGGFSTRVRRWRRHLTTAVQSVLSGGLEPR